MLVGTVTTREVEWDEDERNLMLAHMELESDIGPHGHPMSEATSALADPANPGRQWKYVFRDKPVWDRAAKALAEGRDAYKEAYFKDKPLPAGLHFSVDRVDL